MRAEQARDSGAKYAEQACSGRLVRFKGKGSELCEVWSGHDLRGCHVFELTGDDWEPLVTKHERVSAASLLGYKHGVANAESDAAVKIAELEAQVAQERQWRVDAQELADKAKLELNELHKKHLVESAHAGDKIAGLGNANASFRATIADLTAKLAAVEDGSAFVGEEWFPVGSSVGQLSWLIYRGAAHKDDKMKLVQVRTENLAVAANRYFRYTGPKWAAPLPEPDQPAPEKPKCLEGVPSVLCVVSGDRDSGRAWIYGPTDGKNVAGLDCFDASPLVRSFRLSQLTVFHHAPDAAGLAEEIGGESHGKPAPVNRK